jgi:hypothetical protein
VTEVFASPADRESAYRFIENESVRPEALMKAAHEAAAHRCARSTFVYVPVDKSSLQITDRGEKKGFGMVGTSALRSTGAYVVTALAVTPDGIPQGIAHQRYVIRPRKARSSQREQRKKPLDERESHLWLEAMESVTDTFAAQAPKCRPWFQIDREGDVSSALAWAVDHGQLLTVRGSVVRRVASAGDERSYLRERIASEPVLGSYDVEKSARPGEAARTARVDLRAKKLTLDVPTDRRHRQRRPLDMGVVLVSETAPPEGERALDWMLLTTAPVDDFEAARSVVHGYTQRWRIEEFHRAWKSGACNVEDSQLRSVDHFIRWAVVLASVAVRVVRLAYLARVSPDADAASEFTSVEVRVIRALLKPRNPSPRPTVGDVITWLATLGGYTGLRNSNGPPGFIVLARGLDRIQSALQLAAEIEHERDQW